MLSDRCLSVCLSCLSVTLVYCGQTVGWIKMKLGMRIGLDPGHSELLLLLLLSEFIKRTFADATNALKTAVTR